MREELDRIAGSSNGPETISSLRSRGLEIPCEPVHARTATAKFASPAATVSPTTAPRSARGGMQPEEILLLECESDEPAEYAEEF